MCLFCGCPSWSFKGLLFYFVDGKCVGCIRVLGLHFALSSYCVRFLCLRAVSHLRMSGFAGFVRVLGFATIGSSSCFSGAQVLKGLLVAYGSAYRECWVKGGEPQTQI